AALGPKGTEVAPDRGRQAVVLGRLDALGCGTHLFSAAPQITPGDAVVVARAGQVVELVVSVYAGWKPGALGPLRVAALTHQLARLLALSAVERIAASRVEHAPGLAFGFTRRRLASDAFSAVERVAASVVEHAAGLAIGFTRGGFASDAFS